MPDMPPSTAQQPGPVAAAATAARRGAPRPGPAGTHTPGAQAASTQAAGTVAAEAGPADGATSPPALPDPGLPLNRAARRGGRAAPSGTVHAGSAARSRSAQGRRINPVRRTG